MSLPTFSPAKTRPCPQSGRSTWRSLKHQFLLWGSPQVDLFAIRWNAKLPTFVSPVPNPQALALSLSWQNLWAYTFPPHQLLSKVLTQRGWPSLGFQFSRHLPVTEILLKQPLSDKSSGPRQTPATCLEAVRRSLRETSFSRDSAEGIAVPQASSTKSIYDGKWPIFCAWCGGWETDPFTASVPLIAEFLTYLFWDMQLAPGTVAGYQVAIASAFKHTGLLDVDHDPALTALLASFSRERPRRPRVLLQWDLPLVLMALTRAPFKPLRLAASKFLARKVFFLTLFRSQKG